MKWCLASVAVFAVLINAHQTAAESGQGRFSDYPIIADSSAQPDSFGYTWVDNDNSGSPVYNWIDITTIGTHVTGLGDDNVVGPFYFGFEFPYYWYTSNRCWIASNGYMSLSSNRNFTWPWAGIPNDSLPPDMVAVLTGDLDFSPEGGGDCYFYSNNHDSVVISWINVSEYRNLDSTHTFQVILNSNDSSLTFQYAENHGRFIVYGEAGDLIGMANVNKRVGLQYLRNNVPSNHMWHNGLAIRWHAEPNPNFQAHDVGVLDGFHPGSGADFTPLNQPYILRGLFKNLGTEIETNVKAKVEIKRGTTLIMRDSVIIGSIMPRETVNVEFPHSYLPNLAAIHRVTFSTELTGDANPVNNTKVCELDSYLLPQELMYTTGISGTGRQWDSDFAGYGIDMEVPEPVRFQSAGVFIDQVLSPGPDYLWIIGSDSLGNADFDNILAGDTLDISASDTGWVMFTFPEVLVPANQRFFILSIAAYSGTFSHGFDGTLPLSNRNWAYIGSFEPSRFGFYDDVMINVFCEPGVPPLPGLISGIVYDNYGNPLPGSIDSVFLNTNLLRGVDTSATDGSFQFEVDPGYYRIKFVASGFRDSIISNILVSSEDTTIVNINMTRAPGILSGIITDTSSAPLAVVIDSIFSESNQLRGVDTTNSSGAYRFVLQEGIYKSKLVKAGFRDTTISNINIAAGESTAVDVPMIPIGCDYMIGDINGDSVQNALDVVFAVNYFSGGASPSTPCYCASYGFFHAVGDVNGNCIFNGIDVCFMVRYLKGEVPILLFCPDCPPR